MWKRNKGNGTIGGDMVIKKARNGYSLMELMIAIAISSFVLVGIIGLIGFGTKNMRLTQAQVDLQNQAKDATNHISTYVMEGNSVLWNEASKTLTVTKQKIGTNNLPEDFEWSYYWKKDDGIYFAKGTPSEPADLTADKKHLLLDKVTDFTCEEKKNEDSGKKYLHVTLKLADEDIAEFECSKDIMMRNQ